MSFITFILFISVVLALFKTMRYTTMSWNVVALPIYVYVIIRWLLPMLIHHVLLTIGIVIILGGLWLMRSFLTAMSRR